MKLTFFQQLPDFQGLKLLGLGDLSFQELSALADKHPDHQQAQNIAAGMAGSYGLPGLLAYYFQIKREVIDNMNNGDGYTRLAEKAIAFLRLTHHLYQSDHAHQFNADQFTTYFPDIVKSFNTKPNFWKQEENYLIDLVKSDGILMERIDYLSAQLIESCLEQTNNNLKY